MGHSPAEHFGGKSVVEHLRDARAKGMMASTEIHGIEMPGHIASFADSAKDTAFALLIFWTASFFLLPVKTCLYLMMLFAAGWWFWKIARSALMGWSRLERLHRLIEEERWEIQHHRHQEKEELTELYRAKGLSGKLLEEVVDVLMADDNRLLQVMLEEELGLTLGVYEHPLRQCLGAALGAFFAAIACFSAYGLSPAWGLPIAGAIVISIACIVSTKIERNKAAPSIIWHLAVAAFVCFFVYIMLQLVLDPVWLGPANG